MRYAIYLGGVCALIYLWAVFVSGGDYTPWHLHPRTPDASVLFLGDVMLARDIERRILHDASPHPFAYTGELFAPYTYVVGNFEAAIPETHQPTPNFGYQFSVRPDVAELLSQYGVTHLGLANNHTGDFGSRAITNTETTLASLGLTPFGHPYEQITESHQATMQVGNHTLHIIALNLTVSDSQLTSAVEMLASLPSDDIAVLYIHWGVEYEPTHSSAQQSAATVLADAGADVIIGHHPHVVQDIARIDDTIVFYSLGNFIFDQYFSDAVQEGLAVGLHAHNDEVMLTLHPTASKETRSAPRALAGEARLDSLEELAVRSDPQLRARIQDGVLPLRE